MSNIAHLFEAVNPNHKLAKQFAENHSLVLASAAWPARLPSLLDQPFFRLVCQILQIDQNIQPALALERNALSVFHH